MQKKYTPVPKERMERTVWVDMILKVHGVIERAYAWNKEIETGNSGRNDVEKEQEVFRQIWAVAVELSLRIEKT